MHNNDKINLPEEEICEIYSSNHITHKQIAKRYGVSRQLISKILQKHRIFKPKIETGYKPLRDIGKDNEIKLVKMYQNGTMLMELAEIFDANFYVIKRILSKYDVPFKEIGSWTRKYEVDHNFLDKIDTPQKAIFLGLFFSDGYNCEQSSYFTIGLQEPDKVYLQMFNRMFNENRPLLTNETMGEKANYKQTSMYVGSKRMCKKLNEYGAPQRKSLILEWPNNLSQDLDKYFMRGYFEGDGGISLKEHTQKTKYKNKYYVNKRWSCHITYAGTKKFLTTLKEKLSLLNFGGHLRKCEDRLGKGCWSLSYGGNQQCLKLLKYMYHDYLEWSLPRKYQKYLQLQDIYTDNKHTTKLGEITIPKKYNLID